MSYPLLGPARCPRALSKRVSQLFCTGVGSSTRGYVWILALGVSGIAILLFPLLVANEALETPMTIVGASIIAASHIANMRTCRSLDCHSTS